MSQTREQHQKWQRLLESIVEQKFAPQDGDLEFAGESFDSDDSMGTVDGLGFWVKAYAYVSLRDVLWEIECGNIDARELGFEVIHCDGFGGILEAAEARGFDADKVEDEMWAAHGLGSDDDPRPEHLQCEIADALEEAAIDFLNSKFVLISNEEEV